MGYSYIDELISTSQASGSGGDVDGMDLLDWQNSFGETSFGDDLYTRQADGSEDAVSFGDADGSPIASVDDASATALPETEAFDQAHLADPALGGTDTVMSGFRSDTLLWDDA